MNQYQRQQCDKIISRSSLLSALATCNPIPGGDTLLILVIQSWMIKKLSEINGFKGNYNNSIELLLNLASQRMLLYGSNELLNVLPVGIPIANSIVSYYITNKIGWQAVERLESQI